MDTSNLLIPPHHLRTARQIRESGESRHHAYRSVRDGETVQPERGVFLPAELWRQLSRNQRYALRLQALSMVSSHDLIFTHSSAAHLLGWDHFKTPDRIHISGEKRPGSSRKDIVRHHIPDIHRHILLLPHDIRITTPERTLEDCLRSVAREVEAVILADSALRSGVNRDRVRQALLDSPRPWGRHRALHHLDLADPRSQSAAETIGRLVLRRYNLPEPELQIMVMTRTGKRYLDLGWRKIKLALEVDGRAKYTDYGPTDQALIKERDREKELMAEGWYIVRTDWDELVRHPERLIKRLQEIIAVRMRLFGVDRLD